MEDDCYVSMKGRCLFSDDTHVLHRRELKLLLPQDMVLFYSFGLVFGREFGMSGGRKIQFVLYELLPQPSNKTLMVPRSQ